jgi:hypothetical protein
MRGKEWGERELHVFLWIKPQGAGGGGVGRGEANPQTVSKINGEDREVLKTKVPEQIPTPEG